MNTLNFMIKNSVMVIEKQRNNLNFKTLQRALDENEPS